MAKERKATSAFTSTADRRLLGNLLRASSGGTAVVASQFRARNEHFIERLDALEENRMLRRDDDRYYVTIVGLSELDTPEARAILREAKSIYRFLLDAYRESQTKPVLIERLADELGLTVDRTLLVLRYMIQGNWTGGHNLSAAPGSPPSVTPSETMLRLKTYNDVVDQMRQWQVEHINSRYRSGSGGVAASGLIARQEDEGESTYVDGVTSDHLGTRAMSTVKPSVSPRPHLAYARSEVKARVQKQIDAGEALPNDELDENDAVHRWYKLTEEILRQICTTDALADEFTGRGTYFVSGAKQLDTGYYLRKLLSIMDRLDVLPESSVGQSPDSTNAVRAEPGLKRVFVVHGHDNEAKETVARFLKKLKLDPVILHEKPNQGLTIVEKFEYNANVAFAVVLFTPDDVGHRADRPEEAMPRARQNVLLELGFFMHAIGRKKVCALYKPGVEIPSDYSGVLYLEFDTRGAWRLELAREIKAAGLPVDMNDV